MLVEPCALLKMPFGTSRACAVVGGCLQIGTNAVCLSLSMQCSFKQSLGWLQVCYIPDIRNPRWFEENKYDHFL